MKKGRPGYLDSQKKKEILKTAMMFGLVIAIMATGYLTIHTKKNLLTVVAVLGCLPAGKSLVGVITRWPYHSIGQKEAEEIGRVAGTLPVVYDLVVTSYEKIMPIDCMTISDHVMIGYTRSKKTDPAYAQKHITQILSQNGYQKMTIKIYENYETFLQRLRELEALGHERNEEREQKLLGIVLNISL